MDIGMHKNKGEGRWIKYKGQSTRYKVQGTKDEGQSTKDIGTSFLSSHLFPFPSSLSPSISDSLCSGRGAGRFLVCRLGVMRGVSQ